MSSTVIRPAATPARTSSVSLKTVGREPTPSPAAVTPSVASSVPPPVAAASSSTTPAVTRPVVSSSSSVAPSSSSSLASSSSSSSSAVKPSSALSSSSSSSAAPRSSSSSSSSLKVETVTSTSLIKSSSTYSSASASATSSRLAEGSNGASTSSGSGLSTGAIVGIACGGLAVLAIIALLATRSFRKRARAKRTANRTSIMEWNPPAGFEEKDDIEPYTPPSQSQSYAMQPAYLPDPGYQPQPPVHNSFHAQQYQPGYMAGQPSYPVYAPVAAPTAPPPMIPAAPAPPAHGLTNGSMVRVKQAFVRSLDDELAIVPDQQLYLHTAYDDGWSLCESSNGEKGMVPLTCLEPAASQMTRSNTDKSLSARSQRRSSLYADAGAAGAYLNQPQ